MAGIGRPLGGGGGGRERVANHKLCKKRKRGGEGRGGEGRRGEGACIDQVVTTWPHIKEPKYIYLTQLCTHCSPVSVWKQ